MNMDPNTLNVIALINQNTIETQYGVVRLRLKTKKEKPCPYSFKCINCKDKHQADSNIYLFWRHKFNKEQYTKKYQELCKNRSKSILSSVDKTSL